MKYCPDCNTEYSDDEAICPMDGTGLLACSQAEGEGIPPGFERLGAFDVAESQKLLLRFSRASIPAHIERVERRSKCGHMYRTIGIIQIYIHPEDHERAEKMFSAEWKV